MPGMSATRFMKEGCPGNW